jgi:hypothetical protein
MNESGSLNDLALRLHSRYQPQVEADRYIGSLDIKPDTGYFILIEPGLGYLIQSLQKYYPDGKIAVLHADSRFGKRGSPASRHGTPTAVLACRNFLKTKFRTRLQYALLNGGRVCRYSGNPVSGLCGKVRNL